MGGNNSCAVAALSVLAIAVVATGVAFLCYYLIAANAPDTNQGEPSTSTSEGGDQPGILATFTFPTSGSNGDRTTPKKDLPSCWGTIVWTAVGLTTVWFLYPFVRDLIWNPTDLGGSSTEPVTEPVHEDPTQFDDTPQYQCNVEGLDVRNVTS